MKLKTLTLVAALATTIVAGCGGSDSTSSTDVGNSTDRAFVAEMVPHHKSAVEMATIAQQRGGSQFVKTLADTIVRTQSAEITTMQSEDKKLSDAGVKAGDLGMSEHSMGMHMDTGTLKTADPFDPAFLKMMIPHHKGAVEMARVELDKGKGAKLKALAKSIIASQGKEIDAMTAHQNAR